MPLVSISDNQRTPLPHLSWVRTVLHGMPAGKLRPVHDGQVPGEELYFAFLGRISPEKGIESAIRIAAAVGVKLKVAAKVDEADKKYFEEHVAPLLAAAGANVEFIGEINDAQKPAFLSGARALLFPIDWPEPFGLVMIEAMACGCPVIAFRRGSVPEVMEDGLTGFVVENEAEAIAAIGQLHTTRPRAGAPALRAALDGAAHGRGLRRCLRGADRGPPAAAACGGGLSDTARRGRVASASRPLSECRAAGRPRRPR